MSKSYKVDLPPEFHLTFKTFCREKRIKMKDFAVKAIAQMMKDESRPRVIPVRELRRNVG